MMLKNAAQILTHDTNLIGWFYIIFAFVAVLVISLVIFLVGLILFLRARSKSQGSKKGVTAMAIGGGILGLYGLAYLIYFIVRHN